jgi:hypothetical protein
MNSVELREIGFKEWIKIKPKKYNYNKDVVLNLPKEQGVYVIRTSKPVPRIKGDSDILYIGRGVIQRRIQVLLRSHLPLNFRDYMNKHSAREAFERLLNELGLDVEFSFILAENSKDLETNLLEKFCQGHIEPPPLNNTRK